MQRSFVVMICAALTLAAGRAAAATTVSAPTVATITVDGEISDWTGVPLSYLSNGPRTTAIAHDGQFLYVHFRFSDLELARRVLASGATVWFDGECGHGEQLGLRYRGTEALQDSLREMDGEAGKTSGAPPGAGPPPGWEQPPRRDGQPPPGSGPERAKLGALEVLRDGVAAEVLPEGAKADGPAAACGVVDGVFVFELRMPLVDVNPAAQKKGAEPRVAVGFQMGGPTKAERKEMQGRMRQGGPPGGGFGGGPGGPGSASGPEGGPGGGPPPGGAGGGSGRSEVVWLDVELARLPASP
jgi:hypothetical protein